MFRKSLQAGVNTVRTAGKETDSEEIGSTTSIDGGPFKFEFIALNEVVTGHTIMVGLKMISAFFSQRVQKLKFYYVRRHDGL